MLTYEKSADSTKSIIKKINHYGLKIYSFNKYRNEIP